ncbi:MAG TPA: hypothetical protein DD670_12890 [Planctomycetaceae bacterium]|nr:hypothetical protein [Planctomycetaceae bacterium]
MERKILHHPAFCPARILIAWGFLFVFAAPSFAYTTKSPEVVAMLKSATSYLSNAKHEKPGGWALIGLALFKNEDTSGDPKIQEAAENIAKSVRENVGSLDMYSTGLCLIFLTNYDPNRYEKEIQTLIESLQKKQKPHGGWGYPDRKSGDTSMTQYGVLGSWEAKQAGFSIPQAMVDKVATWLLKTQDPSGAWGYQGEPSSNFQPIKQEEVRHSMAVAGLGSTYICADFFGMTPAVKEADDEGPSEALKEVKQREPEEGPKPQVNTSVNQGLIRAAQGRGDGWIAKNYKIDVQRDVLYYLYGLERYGSFRELAEGKGHRDPDKVEGPKWYNDGVDFLKKAQAKDGSWDSVGQCDVVVNTAFATLFLLRSTQRSIRKARGFGDGTMLGGMGLPEEGKEFIGPDGRVRKQTLTGRGTSLIGALDREDWASVADRFEELKGTPREKLLLSEYAKKLSDPSPAERLKAVKVFIASGNMDNVPALILALDDRDLEVALTARDGLRRITRRINGFGMPDDPSPDDRRRAIEQWRAWYLSICPDTEF